MSASRMANGPVGSPPRIDLTTGHMTSWTDDLPVCRYSGIGFSTNQIYREDGNRREEHDFEDKSFHFVQDDVYLYGVFDGHDAARASNFAAQRMPAELLLGQLTGKTTDEEIREVLYQAFIAVEKSFFESIDDLLAARTNAQLQLPEGISYQQACQQYPDIINKLHDLDNQISGGTTATVALIYNKKLYVANVGDTRALLVTTDKDKILHVSQLTVDHTLDNEEERRRLVNLNLDVDTLCQMKKIGSSDCTRCIGDFHTKGGYKDIDILSSATGEPVIAEPYVTGGIPIDSSTGFLLIMSDGLYHAIQNATLTDRINGEIASYVANEFQVQSTLTGVAQALVDRVVRIHHDAFMTGTPEVRNRCHKRGDITLLVRNFNYPLPNSIGTPTGGNRFLPVSVPYYTGRSPTTVPPTVTIPELNNSNNNNNASSSASGDEDVVTPVASASPPMSTLNSEMETNTNMTQESQNSSGSYSTTNSTQSSEEMRFPTNYYRREKLVLDEHGRVEAYVDFSDFYRAIEAMTESQRETLNAETKPKSGYETITEESDTQSLSSLSASEN